MNQEHTEVFYGKLVRDRIPEMIEKQGFQPQVCVLDDDAYLTELYKKLQEEMSEYLESEEAEEIADILEVLEAICAAKKYSIQEILKCKAQKKLDRGGFENKLYLISKK